MDTTFSFLPRSYAYFVKQMRSRWGISINDGPQDEIAMEADSAPRVLFETIDWGKVTQKYNFIRAFLEDFRVPSDDE